MGKQTPDHQSFEFKITCDFFEAIKFHPISLFRYFVLVFTWTQLYSFSECKDSSLLGAPFWVIPAKENIFCLFFSYLNLTPLGSPRIPHLGFQGESKKWIALSPGLLSDTWHRRIDKEVENVAHP